MGILTSLTNTKCITSRNTLTCFYPLSALRNSSYCPYKNGTVRWDLMMTRLIDNYCATSIEFDYAASYVRYVHGRIVNCYLVHRMPWQTTLHKNIFPNTEKPKN